MERRDHLISNSGNVYCDFAFKNSNEEDLISGENVICSMEKSHM